MYGKRKNDCPKNEMDNLRLSPEKRICNKFDETSIAEFHTAERETMGVRVVDNCAEEHIM